MKIEQISLKNFRCFDQLDVTFHPQLTVLPTLTRGQRHPVVQTRDMLGLNKDPNLVSERKKWFTQAVTVLQTAPVDIDQFLQFAPFRALIATSI